MSNKDTLYQHSDNFILTTVYTQNGELAPSASFPVAEYIIANRRGDILVYLTLGNGIAISGDDFVTTIDNALLTFSGAYEHQFVVYDQLGNRLPPVFKRQVKISPTFKQQEI